jgi:hypothetical protein
VFVDNALGGQQGKSGFDQPQEKDQEETIPGSPILGVLAGTPMISRGQQGADDRKGQDQVVGYISRRAGQDIKYILEELDESVHIRLVWIIAWAGESGK